MKFTSTLSCPYAIQYANLLSYVSICLSMILSQNHCFSQIGIQATITGGYGISTPGEIIPISGSGGAAVGVQLFTRYPVYFQGIYQYSYCGTNLSQVEQYDVSSFQIGFGLKFWEEKFRISVNGSYNTHRIDFNVPEFSQNNSFSNISRWTQFGYTLAVEYYLKTWLALRGQFFESLPRKFDSNYKLSLIQVGIAFQIRNKQKSVAPSVQPR